MTSEQPAVARPNMGDIASRLGEVTVLVAAILFGLGAFSILGQLRRLDLHQPSVLSGFAHDDDASGIRLDDPTEPGERIIDRLG